MIGDWNEDEDENEDWRFSSFGCLFDWLSWSGETGHVTDCVDDPYYHIMLYQIPVQFLDRVWYGDQLSGIIIRYLHDNHTLRAGFLGMYV